MSEPKTTKQQQRLRELSWMWFEKAYSASRSGDRQAHSVAALAHSMIVAAYKNTLCAQKAQEDD